MIIANNKKCNIKINDKTIQTSSAKERICKNCKYHYIEEISFDYPQSCCSKRQVTTEEWLKCNDFEYSDRYIEYLEQQTKKQKEVTDKLEKYIEKETRIYGLSMSIELETHFDNILGILKEVE